MLGRNGILALVVAFAAYYYFNVYSKNPKLASPVVEITSGNIQGIVSLSREGRNFYEYLGIPYAQPPINELRYEPPNPPESWKGVKETNKYGAECAQINILVGGTLTGNEDCLSLNVFTPKVNNDGKLLPAMVFIHGGLFVSGSSNMYRPDFFMDEDVVLVTINYRLSALGFLSTGDSIVPGNMGLKDQALALRWVQENIKMFGGDPSQVTIFGESAGGASVHFQILSPTTEGLFHRAISQSGVTLNPWAIRSHEQAQSKRYANLVNCPNENSEEMITCLKKKPVKELLEAHREYMNPLRDPTVFFGPVVEVPNKNAFLTELPHDIIAKGKAQRVPWMTGMNSHEGLLSSPVIVRDEKLLAAFNDRFVEVMPNYIFYTLEDRKVLKSDFEEVRNFYFGDGERIDTPEKMENYTNLITDYVWGVGLQEAVKLQSEFSPVYPYYYAYKGKFTLSNILLALKGKYPAILELSWFFLSKWVNVKLFGIHLPHYGPCHGDEMALQFPLTGLVDVRQGHPDYEMSKRMVKLWTSFASNQIPLNSMGPTWLPHNPKSKEINHLKIDTIPEIIGQPDPERLELWKGLRK